MLATRIITSTPETIVMKKILLYWLPMPVLGFLNGMARSLYAEQAGEPSAHQISAVTLIIILWTYGYLIRKRLNIQTRQRASVCALMWMLLTVASEFLLGLAFRQPLETILANYDISRGQWWPWVVMAVGLMPFLLIQPMTTRVGESKK
jgi:hypothetical protein